MIRIHATSIALNGHGILLTGASGSGKSDLALRMIDRGAQLVSDDYTELTAEAGQLIARPPATIAGQMEVRGVGIIRVPYEPRAPVAFITSLDLPVSRLPESPLEEVFLGVSLFKYPFAALEPSAPIKLERLLAHFLEGMNCD